MIVPLLGWAVLAVAVLPWIYLLDRRSGAAQAVAAGALLGLLGLLVVMIVSTALPVPLVVAVAVAATAIAVAGVVLALRARRHRVAHDRRRAWRTWLPVLIGPAAWLAVMAVAQLLPGAAALSWVMQGDSANNVLFGREVIGQQGIAIGPGENPVPLPAGMLGLTMDFGRAGVGTAGLLRHDVTAFAALWVLLIAAAGAMCGLAAGVVARAAGAGRRVIATSACLGSVVVFSWFVTGYSTEFGFFNTHLALIVLAAAVIVALDGDRRPAVVLGLLAVAGTLMLAIWSPLIVIPGALGLLVIARSARTLLASRGAALAGLLLGVGQLATYGLVAVLPGLLANGEALGAAGGVFSFSVVMLPAAGAVVVVLAALAVRNARALVLQVAVVTVVAGGAGLGVLLLAAGWHWTYYPHKYAWMAAIVFLLLAVGLIVPVIVRLRWPSGLRISAIAFVALAMIEIVIAVPQIDSGELRQHPFAAILGGTVMGDGDDVAGRIFELVDTEHPRVLWRSGDPFEATIDFWLLQMQVEQISDEFDLRLAAYNIAFQTETAELCDDLELIGGRVEVLTTDATLADDLASTCPGADAVVTRWDG